MDSLLMKLSAVIALAVWGVAAFGFDVLAKDLSKKKKIIATICLIAAFIVWWRGAELSDESGRRYASERLIENLQEDGLLKEGDYSNYFQFYE